MTIRSVDENLKQYATDKQATYINAINEFGSLTKAADAMGKSVKTLSNCLKRVKAKAAKRGYAPNHDMTHPVPEGFAVKGTSTLYTEEGKKLQWVKTNQDAQKQAELMREVVEAMKEDIEPELPELPLPIETDETLLNCFVITDYHLGMNAWGEETGADWDMQIAENLLVDWFTAAIRSAPQAQTAVLAQLGDFIHWDGLDPLTPASKNVLDADTRKRKIVRVAIRS